MTDSLQKDSMPIMMIDDSNTIRRSAEIFLGQASHRVVLAEDGFDALAKLAEAKPPLIFGDILMPRLDGYQFCALVRHSTSFHAIDPGGQPVSTCCCAPAIRCCWISKCRAWTGLNSPAICVATTAPGLCRSS